MIQQLPTIPKVVDTQTKLSVNINKIATIRNARGGTHPNVSQAAIDCEVFGADGITVHPRPDERHITKNDVYAIAPLITTEFNIEGYPNERFMKIIEEIKPKQATLVPDPPGVLTSNAGWDTKVNADQLKEVIDQLKTWGVRSSIFIETDEEMIEGAAKLGVDRIELYTGPYAEGFHEDKAKAIAPFIAAANKAIECDLGINAGHDLNLENLNYFKKNIPNLLEVSIGHALISDALYHGLENTIMLYKAHLL
ncbi:MAG: pyridoxine 5'-phosphate synthase [Crocinitomicaceae bacterium]|nr:pyridoxine 5'-phosphate synthase [Crocinitomicaceae bacterium]